MLAAALLCWSRLLCLVVVFLYRWEVVAIEMVISSIGDCRGKVVESKWGRWVDECATRRSYGVDVKSTTQLPGTRVWL